MRDCRMNWSENVNETSWWCPLKMMRCVRVRWTVSRKDRKSIKARDACQSKSSCQFVVYVAMEPRFGVLDRVYREWSIPCTQAWGRIRDVCLCVLKVCLQSCSDELSTLRVLYNRLSPIDLPRSLVPISWLLWATLGPLMCQSNRREGKDLFIVRDGIKCHEISATLRRSLVPT